MRPTANQGLLLVLWLLALWTAPSAAADPACPDSITLPCPYSAVSVVGTGSPGQLLDPRRVAIGPDQSIYVVDTPSASNVDRVVQYDSAGRFVRVVASTAAGQDEPTDVAPTPNGNVFTLDYRSHVGAFAAGGALLGGWDLTGAPQGAARFPDSAIRLAAAPDGTLFALFDSGLVEHLDEGGTVLGSFQIPAAALSSGELAVAPNGDVIVGAGQIFRFTPSGQLVAVAGYYGGGLTIDAGGGLLETSGNQVLRIGADGSPAVLYSAAPGVQLAGLAATATGIAVTYPSGVLLLDADGTVRASFGAPDAGALQAPQAAWGTADGGLLVADSGRIARYDAGGSYLGRADDGNPLFATVGAFDPLGGGSVVTDTRTVERFSQDGRLLATWPAPYNAKGVAVAPDGTVYVTTDGGVVAYGPGGALLRQFGVDNRPTIAVGPTGRLLLASFLHQGVDVRNPDGTPDGSVPGLECTSVTSMAIDPAGRIFVIERTGIGFSGIGVLAADGTWLAQFGAAYVGGALSVDAGDRLTIALPNLNAVVRLQIDIGALHPIQPLVPTGRYCNLSGASSLGSSTLTVTRRVARVRIACTGAPATRCAGTATLHLAARAPTLGQAAFAVAGGSTAVVQLRLNRHYSTKRRRTRALLVLRPTGGRVQSHPVKLLRS